MPEHIGILGGAFDPPHIGHLLLGETARQELALQRVLYLPTGQPPHKQDSTVTPAHQRLAMTELAIADNEAFDASDIDIVRPSPHYTSTLRPYLEEAFPGASFTMLIGGDSLIDLPQWHDPHTIVQQWQLAVLPRPQSTVDWANLEESVPGARYVTRMLDGASVAISSTQIRRWVRAGRSLRYLMPPSVAHYIAKHQLYRDHRQTREGQADAASASSDASAGGAA